MSLAIIGIVDKNKFEIDNDEYALGILLAFESINHDILSKLEHYGFRGHSLLFLRSYFTDRRQYTSTNNCKSNIRSITYGVPHGTILCPLLFLLHTNDIQYGSRKIDLRLFADDTAIFLHQKDIDVLMQDGEETVKEIMTWFETNKLCLSLGKSNFILFHGKQKIPKGK